jgi:Lon protease-like protein
VVRNPLRAGLEPRDGGNLRVAPLFPLPNVFLFPGCVMPLHVFEPRYRQMVEDLLDGPGQVVMGTLEQDHAGELFGAPPVRPIAGIGEICRHERLPDGRFLIWLFGLSRVRIREVASVRLYRRVSVEPFEEIAPPSEREPELRERLRRAILARCEQSAQIPAELPISCLADLLLQRLGLSQPEMEALFEEVDVETRAQCGLQLHEKRSSNPRNRNPR